MPDTPVTRDPPAPATDDVAAIDPDRADIVRTIEEPWAKELERVFLLNDHAGQFDTDAHDIALWWTITEKINLIEDLWEKWLKTNGVSRRKLRTLQNLHARIDDGDDVERRFNALPAIRQRAVIDALRVAENRQFWGAREPPAGDEPLEGGEELPFRP